jgi:hypothetical protein
MEKRRRAAKKIKKNKKRHELISGVRSLNYALAPYFCEGEDKGGVKTEGLFLIGPHHFCSKIR